jgi:hypothetical protein
MGGRWTHDAISKTDATEFGLVCGGVFSAILSHFCPFWSISAIFGSGFSLFCLFSNLPIRYTRAEEVTLYYDPSETSTEAPQLGPRACRIFDFCPACGFRILCKACFTKTVLEYSQEVLMVPRRTHPTDPTHATHPTDPTHATHRTRRYLGAGLSRSGLSRWEYMGPRRPFDRLSSYGFGSISDPKRTSTTKSVRPLFVCRAC